jgi:hypothetical protein
MSSRRAPKCSWYRGLYVRCERVGVVHRSSAIFLIFLIFPVPRAKPPRPIRNFHIAVWECPLSADRKPNMVQVRYYSISSSAVVAPTTPSLTVAVVEETMKSGRVHRGVASTWLVRTPLPSQQREREREGNRPRESLNGRSVSALPPNQTSALIRFDDAQTGPEMPNLRESTSALRRETITYPPSSHHRTLYHRGVADDAQRV